jgi:hypothetical protein
LRLTEIEVLPPVVAEACVDGAPGQGRWGSGSIVCYVEDGIAKIRWTDERSGLYGIVDATDRNLAALHAWWRSNGRRLGVPSSS